MIGSTGTGLLAELDDVLIALIETKEETETIVGSTDDILLKDIPVTLSGIEEYELDIGVSTATLLAVLKNALVVRPKDALVVDVKFEYDPVERKRNISIPRNVIINHRNSSTSEQTTIYGHTTI